MAPLSLLLALSSASAQDFTVTNVADLQNAAANVAAGDIIEVQGIISNAGTIAFTIPGGFTIRGQNTCSSIAACPDGFGPGTYIEISNGNNPVIIEDLSFGPNDDNSLHIAQKDAELYRILVAGHADAPTLPDRGAGLSFAGDAGDSIYMEDSFVTGNAGPAMKITGGDAQIFTSVFSNNGYNDGLPIYGAGLQFVGNEITLGEAYIEVPGDWSSDVISRGNTFSGNYGYYGGGAFINAAQGAIDANTFTNNVANDNNQYNEFFELNSLGAGGFFNGAGLGGGLYVENGGEAGRLDIRWNVIESNWAWDAGGIHLQNPEDVVLANNVIAQNWAIEIGGGLSIIETDAQSTARPRIVNNSLVGNVAGLSLVYQYIQVVGGGGNARIDGVIPDFRNNVVTHANYGGGVLGVEKGSGPFEAGDDFNDWFQYNIFYWNCDVYQCLANSIGDIETTGQFQQYAMHPSNVTETDPEFIYFGDVREPQILSDGNAYPDVFCMRYTSPGVGGGDLNEANLGDADYLSDMGHCGGLEAFYWNRDRDGDGWLQHQDCLDDPAEPQAADTFPGAYDQCDFEDNDCNGIIDDGFDIQWYPDVDGDGYGDAGSAPTLSCGEPTAGSNAWAPNNDDCDDGSADVSPGMKEVCDSFDNDCDGIINNEEDVDARILYPDVDGDGYATDSGNGRLVCNPPDVVTAFFPATPRTEETSITNADQLPYIYYAIGEDCNDANPLINPRATEQCDAIDHNCNDTPYDVPSSQASDTYYLDSDADGWGDVLTEIFQCEGEELPDPGNGVWVTNGGDCDEANPLVNNGADEVCDLIDNDCNAIIDDNPADGQLRYEDFDNDGFGNPATALRACSGTHPSTYTASVGGDCDDSDPTVTECAECGCQATPTPGSMGLLTGGLLALFGLRRRR